MQARKESIKPGAAFVEARVESARWVILR